MTHSETYLRETVLIAESISPSEIEALVTELEELRSRKGRLFIVGLGGSAANASHAANDFQKLAGIEAYSGADNISELTARANDEGWSSIFSGQFWRAGDSLLVLSVGGGTLNVSFPLVTAIDKALNTGMRVLGIVGRDGGYTRKMSHACVLVPNVEPLRVTPHTEGWQMVVLHALVSHPTLQRQATKW